MSPVHAVANPLCGVFAAHATRGLLSTTLWFGGGLAVGIVAGTALADAPRLPLVRDVELQPLAAQVKRIIEAEELLGEPLSPAEREELDRAFANQDEDEARETIQRVLDSHCLLDVNINPESRVKVAVGPAKPVLAEKGWRQFLVKVRNEAGVTAELKAVSPNGLSLHDSPGQRTESDKAHQRSDPAARPADRDLWLDVQMFKNQPLGPALSGLRLEYRILQLYSRDAGMREARLEFNVGQGTQDLGFRNEADVVFNCLPATPVTFQVRDEADQPVTAMFVIRDHAGRVYPSPAKRLAPDFAFQPQVYRGDGETELLPSGDYTVEYTRGPEYLPQRAAFKVSNRPETWTFALKRWIDPARLGWWSGDHHIHAAGCAHYTRPTEGVHAPDMMRHCLGEDLKVGCNLTWGPCFDYQKQFFTGKDDAVSRPPYLLHYDVEVSGFGSHESGHLCLLHLHDQIPPGGDSTQHWPTLCLNTLRWAKAQGAVCGPAHSGWGLEVHTDDLPNYIVPPFDGIGANEYIVDVTHEVPGPDGKPVPAVDFMSMVDTPYVWELNMWYHTLNAGFRTRISGETDFPCIYGERVGLGRSYVKLDQALDYAAWCEGVRKGRSYVGDGHSHLLDFEADATSESSAAGAPANRRRVRVGEDGSELRLERPGPVKFKATVAAWLPEQPNERVHARPYADKPYWDLERARIGESRAVAVELVLNGRAVERQVVKADSTLRPVVFTVTPERSSWAALRILPSSHTNPIWIRVADKPVRASRRSLEWCLEGVDRCWSQKQRFIRTNEMAQATAAYDHAREVYRQRLAECEAE